MYSFGTQNTIQCVSFFSLSHRSFFHFLCFRCSKSKGLVFLFVRFFALTWFSRYIQGIKLSSFFFPWLPLVKVVSIATQFFYIIYLNLKYGYIFHFHSFGKWKMIKIHPMVIRLYFKSGKRALSDELNANFDKRTKTLS